MKTDNSDKEILNNYISKNKELFQQPIIKQFFSEKDNKKLLVHFVKGNARSKEKLDSKFRSFYYQAKVISYIANLIHFYSIDYDKKVNQISSRFPLVMDKSISKNQDDSLKIVDLIHKEEVNYEEEFECKRLENIVTDETICKSIHTLTEKQKDVLELVYIRGYTPKEVAELYGDSKQNISNIKSKALRKIREYYSSNTENRDHIGLSS